jgi:outer membrane autotransporter protein
MSTCSRLRALLSSTILAGVHPASYASLLALAALTAAPAPALAQTNWTGTVSSDWFTAGNWSNGVPGGGDDTTIDTVTPNLTVVANPGARAQFLNVGATATGQLVIQNGGTLRDVSFGSIGVGANSTGTVIVTGAGSQLEIEGGTVVGFGGTGTLFITDGATVSSGFSDIGRDVGSSGTVTVSGVGSQWIVGTFDLSLDVGAQGAGALNIANGGTVTSLAGTSIGKFEKSLGAVTVSAGGRLESTSILVGAEGTGLLTILSGGSVSSGLSVIGTEPTGIGTVRVSGAGSQWNMSGTAGLGGLVVGLRGTGFMTIENGGAVTSDFGRLGAEANSTGEALITGTGSQWTTLNDMTVGRAGRGTLDIESGGRVTSATGMIGDEASGSGTVTVTGVGSQWINSGNLTVGNAGSGAIFVRNGGTVSSQRGFIGESGGIGTVTVDGAAAQWIVRDDLNVGVLNQGTLTIANGGRVTSADGFIGTSAAGNGRGDGTVTVTGAGSQWNVVGFVFAGAAGDGALTIANGGTVNAGAVSIALQSGSTGTVNIGAAAGQAPVAPGTLNVPIVTFGAGNGTLNFNHTFAEYLFSSQIVGSGGVNVLAGTTVFVANSSNYTGATTVTGGTLNVIGSIAGSSVTVNAGGTLGGTGTVGTTTLNGTLSPGAVNAIGTTAVQGNLAFSSAATYLVQITPSTADRVNVTGTATVDGTVRVVAASGTYAPGTTYTIVNAGAVAGTFDRVTTNSIFLTPTLIHNANNVLLSLALDFTGAGRTPNQINTARGVQSLGGGNPVFDAIFNIPNADQARAAFDRLSGEVHASAAGVMLDESRHMRDAVLGRARQSYGSTVPAALAALGQPGLGYAQEEPAADTALSYAAAGTPVVRKAPQAVSANERVFATWGQAIGAWGHTDGDGNAAALDRKATGVIGGVDATFGDRWRLGVASGYTRSSLSVDARASSAGIDSAHLAAYGGGRLGAWGVRGGAAFTWHEIDTRRSIAFPGFADSTKADYTAHSAQAFGELGYSIVTGRAAFEPFAAVAYVNLDNSGFRESGGAAALTAREQSLATIFTTLGLRGAIVLGAGNGMALTARGTLGWRHAFGDVTPALAFSFASGGVPFTIAGVPIAKDSALLETGFDIDLTSSAKLGLAYSGQLASDAQDHAVKGNFLWKF